MPDISKKKITSVKHQFKSTFERRGLLTGKMDDLDESIQVSRQAVQATPNDHPNLAALLKNLGNCLERRYERTGNI